MYGDVVSFVCRQIRVPSNREIGNAAWTNTYICLTKFEHYDVCDILHKITFH